MSFLEINKINKSFSNHQALKDVSISIPQGSIFGLLGPNGAGKTTLIRIITRIINQDSGSISLGKVEITPKMVRKIGYLPEERGLYKKMKVAEQLLYLGRLKGLSTSAVKSKIRYWLERMDLMPWAYRRVDDLSKGMAQKVQFIATVLHEPELLILDEPFSGFDPVNADLIKDEIIRLQQHGTTIIFSTHRMESVEELCDHIALINKSEKILDGKLREIKNEFKDGSYELNYDGELKLGEDVEVISKSMDEFGLNSIVIKDTKQHGSNELLKRILAQVEVHSFKERIPSINEIFIQKVK